MVLLYFNDIACKLVAKTGIATDSYHIGKLTLESFREDPNFVLQVDGITDESITFKQAEEMTVRCAYALRKMGLKKGDVIVIMSNNNIHLTIPYHAAMYDGIVVAALDRNLGVTELKNAFEVIKPKLIFSQSETLDNIQTALKAVNNDAEVITYDKGAVRTLDELLQTSNESIKDFKPTDFKPEDELAVILPTSGTTGLPKFAAISYKALLTGCFCAWTLYRKFPYPIDKMVIITSVFQWISAHMLIITSPLVRVTRLMTYMPITRQTARQVINKYRPSTTIVSPTLLTTLLKDDECGPIDFTCFDKIFVGGSAVFKEVLDAIHAVSPNSVVYVAYGTTECIPVTIAEDLGKGVGRPFGWVQLKLVDLETQKVITEPNKPGEMWVKSPTVFKGYYNNPEATKEVFSEDGWFKTGDILYQDENRNFYFVDRAKLLLKYKNEQVSPTEVESVIVKHPAVEAVAVVGKPHLEFGDLITAFVVKKPGAQVTAKEIKELVAENLSLSKHLSGGVIFLDKLPITPTHKVQRTQLKEMTKTIQAE